MEAVFSDDAILLVNKPAGLPVLPDGWQKDAPYLVKLLEELHGKIWVVHRIDKFTSGLVLFALTAEAHRSLSVQFEKRRVEKIYHAVIVGAPRWDEKTAAFPLRANVGRRHRTMVDYKKGAPAETRFRILARYPSAALVEAAPVTGRTHQVRVHAYALGHPLVGDALYGAPDTDVISRPALHARSLAFSHPKTGTPAAFSADYPPDFETAIRRLKGG